MVFEGGGGRWEGFGVEQEEEVEVEQKKVRLLCSFDGFASFLFPRALFLFLISRAHERQRDHVYALSLSLLLRCEFEHAPACTWRGPPSLFEFFLSLFNAFRSNFFLFFLF